MADICSKLTITLLFVNTLTTQTQSAKNGNPFDVTLSQSHPTHRISYEDAVATLDRSEPPVEMTWTIRTDENMRLQVNFHSFRLLNLYSVLMFGDGTQPVDDIYGVSFTKLAGFSHSDRPSTVISLTHSLWIRFRSHITKADWQYEFIMDVERIQSGVDDLKLTSDSPTASITSPNYPNKYPNNSYRLWTVQAPVGSVITVNVTAFDLVSTSDNHHLLIGDTTDRFVNSGITTWVRWTGKKPDDDVLGIFHYRSQGPSIYVLFTTSYKSGGTGFSLELRANFETPVTTQPTTSTIAHSTTADIESSPPRCVCASTPLTAITTNTTTEEEPPGSHPVAKDSLPTEMMGSAEEQRECRRNEFFGFRFILVIVAVVLVLVFLSAAAGCYFQRRMNVNKLLITIDKKPDPRVRTQIWSAVQPVGKFDSDMSNALHEEADLVADIFPYGPIFYGRPSSSCFSYKGRMDDFGYQLTETVEASSPGYSPALIHTYFDEHLIPDRRIAEFKTYGKT